MPRVRPVRQNPYPQVRVHRVSDPDAPGPVLSYQFVRKRWEISSGQYLLIVAHRLPPTVKTAETSVGSDPSQQQKGEQCMGRAGWLPRGCNRRYLTSIAMSYGSRIQRSIRVPLRPAGRSKTMSPGAGVHAACGPRTRQKWTACSDAGKPGWIDLRLKLLGECVKTW